MRTILLLLLLFGSNAALAAETGCDKLSWPLDRERAALQRPEPPGGGEIALGKAVAIATTPFAETPYAMRPERGPKNGSARGAVVRFTAPPTSGEYFVTIAENGWVDVIQDRQYVKPNAFTGVLECPGVRKSLRVRLEAKPFIIQLSDTAAASAGLMVSPAR